MSIDNAPKLYNAYTLIEEVRKKESAMFAVHCTLNNPLDGKEVFVPHRPPTITPFFTRLKYAWWVITGKADVLVWPGQE